MSLEQNIIRVLSIGDRCYNSALLTSSDRTFLIRAYYDATGIKLGDNCGVCMVTIYEYFKSISTNKSNPKTSSIMQPNKKNCQFEIHAGKTISLHGLAHVYTNANITDEAAFDILKRAPRAIAMFKTYPPDWKEQANAYFEGGRKKVTPAPPAVATSNTATFDNKEFNIEKIKRDNLESQSVKELKSLAKKMDVPEFGKMSKNELVDALVGKIG